MRILEDGGVCTAQLSGANPRGAGWGCFPGLDDPAFISATNPVHHVLRKHRSVLDNKIIFLVGCYKRVGGGRVLRGGGAGVTSFCRFGMFQEALHVFWRICCMHRIQCVEHIGECPFLFYFEVQIKDPLRDASEG